MTMQKVLMPLNESSYLYHSKGAESFFVPAQEIEAVEVEEVYFKNLFLASSINSEEVRDIHSQVFRCRIKDYPVDKVLNLLNKDWNKLCWTQRQMKAFIELHGKEMLESLEVEEPKLPSHLLFLGKNKGRYWLTEFFHRDGQLAHGITGFRSSPMSIYGFLVTPQWFPPKIIEAIVD